MDMNPTPMRTNGVDVAALEATVRAVMAAPELAAFRFRATNRWLGGDRNRSTMDGFAGAGGEHAHATTFELDNAEPPVLLGADAAPNPVEYVLHALAGCLTTTMVYHAAARGIAVDAIDTALEGDLDLRGFLGLDPAVRPGFGAIRVRMRVAAAADADTLRTLSHHSPVYDIVSRSVPVEVTVDMV